MSCRFATLQRGAQVFFRPLVFSTCRKYITAARQYNSLRPLAALNVDLLRPVNVHCNLDERHYAKGKSKGDKKDKGKKGGKPKVSLTDEELNEVINFEKLSQQLDGCVAHLQQEYIEQLSLRTSAASFDNLSVDTPDGTFPLIQLGQVAQKNPSLIVINLVSVPQYIPEVKSAIEKSGMNLNPQQDGTTLFVPVPKITREHREGMVKSCKMLCDKSKEKMREVQNKYVRDLKKHKEEHSEDLLRGVQEYIQSTTKDHMSKAEDLMHIKQKELAGK